MCPNRSILNGIPSARPGLARRLSVAAGIAAVMLALAGCDSGGSSPAPQGTAKKHEKDHSKKDGDHETATPPAAGNTTTAPEAATPDEPNAIAFYLSMHGAAGSDTIVGVTDDGRLLGSVVRDLPADNQLHLLRGLSMLPDRSVLVSNAFKTDTCILRFGPIAADRSAAFASVLVQGGPENPSLTHAYGVVPAPDGSIYCSNQDTNTVTRYGGPTSTTPGAPLPVPPSLANISGLTPGVFIVGHDKDPQGLLDVRGIAFGPDGLLYVADKGRHQVAAYDPVSGARKKIVASEKHGLKHPIQLAFTDDGASMFISDNGTNSVWRVDLKSGEVHDFVPSTTPGLKAPSALVVDGDRLLVASRTGRTIFSVRISDGQVAATPFVSNLPDDPEFLLKVK